MSVCSFFLQGRCRYGEKCWNEHPRGGGRGYINNNNNSNFRAQQSSSYRSGGFGNKVWVSPSQRSGRDYVAPPSFSRGGSDWGRGGGGGGGGGEWDSKSFSFTSQNRFSTLDAHQTFDRSDQDENENDKFLETVRKDMEMWENSGQWQLSCYSAQKAPLSGFTELSPEELRLEYYKCRETGNLQSYVSSVQQLASQWRQRVQELKMLNSDVRSKLISELKNPSPQPLSVGFGSAAPAFGNGFGAATSDVSSFSFKASSSCFGSTDTQTGPAGFAGVRPAQSTSQFGSSQGGSSSSSSTPSVSTFSFAAPVVTGNEQPAGFRGAGSASGFSFSSAGFGSLFGSASATGGGSIGQSGSTSGEKGATPDAPSIGRAAGAPGKVFTPRSELTAEELKQFEGRRFTLGQVPVRPPPADMLTV